MHPFILQYNSLSLLERISIEHFKEQTKKVIQAILSPRICLFSLDIPPEFVQITFLLFILYFNIALWCNIRAFRYHRREDIGKIRTALQALLAVITPTSSLWPVHYTSIVRNASFTPNQRINVPLSCLLDDIYDGCVEIRDLVNDLPELLHDSIRVYGWAIQIEVEPAWWGHVLDWLYPSEHTFPAIKMLICTQRNEDSTTSSSNFDISAQHPSQMFPIAARHCEHIISLDTMPYIRINTIMTQLWSTLRRGTLIGIELTTLSPRISFYSKLYIICALPFLPRKHTRSVNGRASLPQRTSLSLCLSLQELLDIISAGPAGLTVESVSNVSRQYTEILTQTHGRLEDDRDARASFVGEWGVNAWREHLFLTAWEAALFTRGCLERWIVQVHR